jgi:transcriptional regulator with XRE-family HTH domain
MTISKETIGRRIADARKTACLTQAELAEKIDISEKYLSRIECGKQLPSIVIVLKICEVLYISVDELLGQAKGYNNQPVQNEMSGLSSYEQKRIAEIIKIIMEIKNNT